MGLREVLALIRRIDFAARIIDQTLISKILMQVFVIRVQEASTTDLS